MLVVSLNFDMKAPIYGAKANYEVVSGFRTRIDREAKVR
jgi:hypothetical protein